jgi:hypothetical protein
VTQKSTEPNRNELTRDDRRRGGVRSGEVRRRKKERRSLLDVWRSRGDPDQLFDGLSKSAAGNVALARILEAGGAFDPERPKPPEVVPPEGGHSFRDLFRALVETRNEALWLGISLTDEQRATVLGPVEGEGVQEESKNHAPVGDPFPDTAVEGGGSPDSPPRGPHAPQKNNHPANDFLARQVAEYKRQRAEMGLAPNDGNNDKPWRGPRLTEPEWLERGL